MKKHSDFTGGHKTESLQKSRTVPHFKYIPRAGVVGAMGAIAPTVSEESPFDA